MRKPCWSVAGLGDLPIDGGAMEEFSRDLENRCHEQAGNHQ